MISGDVTDADRDDDGSPLTSLAGSGMKRQVREDVVGIRGPEIGIHRGVKIDGGGL